MRVEKTVGVIGGSGFTTSRVWSDVHEVQVETPFGGPSDAYVVGMLGVRMIFLPRHGRGHRFLPSEVNYAANIYGMKKLGAEYILSVSAVGRCASTFGPAMSCCRISSSTARAAVGAHFWSGSGRSRVVRRADLSGAAGQPAPGSDPHVADRALHYGGGTYLVMEGRRFRPGPSRTCIARGGRHHRYDQPPEAKLAREAEICYATLALPTDYDCWKHDEEAVSVDAVIAAPAQRVASPGHHRRLGADGGCLPRSRETERTVAPCPNAARHVVMTAPTASRPRRASDWGCFLVATLANPRQMPF